MKRRETMNDTYEEVMEAEGKFEIGDRLNENFDPYKRRHTSLKRRFSERVFGKLAISSMRFGIVNLVICTLGTGFLAMPKAFACCGLVPGILIISILALSNIYSYYLISHVQALVRNFFL